jgi:signal recognition particle receptor subunit beta
VALSYSQSRELHLKLVLYGPAGAGKSSTLNGLYRSLRADVRGQLVTVQTGSDRTLFFDFYPPPPARLLGSAMHIQIYTAAGAVTNEATRRALLVGADGIMFIADSQRGRERDNIQALEELRNCLFDLNVSPDQLAFVMAWNKRDLADALSVGELEAGLNLNQAPSFATMAQVGQGVFDAFRALSSRALDSALKRRPEMTRDSQRPEFSSTSDVVTSRRVLAMQDAQRAMSLLQRRFPPENQPNGSGDGGYADALADSVPQPASSSAPSLAGGLVPERSLVSDKGGVPVTTISDPMSGGHSGPVTTSSAEASPARSEQHLVPPDVLSVPRRAAHSGQRVIMEAPQAPAVPQQESAALATASALSRDPQLAGRSARSDGNAGQPGAPSSISRDIWFSHLVPAGSLRAQLQDVERQILAGQWSAGVRRAASIFYALTAAEATREPDEGPAWRGLVLGLPVERYLRFRQAVQDAEAGKCSLEDGLFALFFLLDAALRKEAWLARGA